jgi:hypothetical protein
MADSPFHAVTTPEFNALFMLSADDEAQTVENVDAEITLPDGTRWSATFLTLDEIRRIMDRWRSSGECLDGKYFQCHDLVIVRQGGVPTMVETLQDIVINGGPRGVLAALGGNTGTDEFNYVPLDRVSPEEPET